MTGWNLPPGCTGSEWQIAGISKEDETICEDCALVDEGGDCDPNGPNCPLNIRGKLCPQPKESEKE